MHLSDESEEKIVPLKAQGKITTQNCKSRTKIGWDDPFKHWLSKMWNVLCSDPVEYFELFLLWRQHISDRNVRNLCKVLGWFFIWPVVKMFSCLCRDISMGQGRECYRNSTPNYVTFGSKQVCPTTKFFAQKYSSFY